MKTLRTKRMGFTVSLIILASMVLAACQTANSGAATPMGNAYGTSPTAVGSTGNKTAAAAEVKTSSKDGLGTFLVDGKGMTLYRYTKDSPGVSNCKDGCLDAWQPLLTNGDPVAGRSEER